MEPDPSLLHCIPIHESPMANFSFAVSMICMALVATIGLGSCCARNVLSISIRHPLIVATQCLCGGMTILLQAFATDVLPVDKRYRGWASCVATVTLTYGLGFASWGMTTAAWLVQHPARVRAIGAKSATAILFIPSAALFLWAVGASVVGFENSGCANSPCILSTKARVALLVIVVLMLCVFLATSFAPATHHLFSVSKCVWSSLLASIVVICVLAAIISSTDTSVANEVAYNLATCVMITWYAIAEMGVALTKVVFRRAVYTDLWMAELLLHDTTNRRKARARIPTLVFRPTGHEVTFAGEPPLFVGKPKLETSERDVLVNCVVDDFQERATQPPSLEKLKRAMDTREGMYTALGFKDVAEDFIRALLIHSTRREMMACMPNCVRFVFEIIRWDCTPWTSNTARAVAANDILSRYAVAGILNEVPCSAADHVIRESRKQNGNGACSRADRLMFPLNVSSYQALRNISDAIVAETTRFRIQDEYTAEEVAPVATRNQMIFRVMVDSCVSDMIEAVAMKTEAVAASTIFPFTEGGDDDSKPWERKPAHSLSFGKQRATPVVSRWPYEPELFDNLVSVVVDYLFNCAWRQVLSKTQREAFAERIFNVTSHLNRVLNH